MSNCHRTDAGYFTAEHRNDCRERACAGCMPCERDDHGTPVRHCEHRKRCTSHLAEGEHACPKCLSKIRGNLTRIVELATIQAAEEALHAGVDSEAASIVGPKANVITSRWRRADAARAGEWVEETDWTDPHVALGEWEHCIREDLGHDGERLVSETLSGSAGYLDWVLTDLARDEDQALVLGDLAVGISQTLAHLESVLHDSRAGDRGERCFDCDASRGEGDALAPRLTKRYPHWCDDGDCKRFHDANDQRDWWQCPNGHKFEDDDYRERAERKRIRGAEWLTARELEQGHGVKAGTLRQWAAREQIRRKRSSAGIWLYDVKRAKELHADTMASA